MKLVNYKIAVNNIDDLETFGTGLRVFHCKVRNRHLGKQITVTL